MGGRNKLPMRELVSVLADLGLKNIKTYIQSGNVVFASEESDTAFLSKKIKDAVNKNHGFAPEVILLKPDELEAAIAKNPFPEAESEPKTLHLVFLNGEPDEPDMSRLDKMKNESERFALQGKVFYLHAPDGIGRSKLAVNVDKALDVTATARNWRSVGKIMLLAKQCNS